MSPRFEELLVFGVISILVALFAWIYTRDRQPRVGLWMLGWLAIFVHFTAPAIDDFFPWVMHYTLWIKVSTLIVAGTFFLLSVSEVFVNRRRRTTFVCLISTAAFLYVTAMGFHIRAPWLYVGLLTVSCVYAGIQAALFYGWRSPYLYSLYLLLP